MESLVQSLENSNTFLSFSAGPNISLAVILLILAVLGLLLNLLYLVWVVKAGVNILPKKIPIKLCVLSIAKYCSWVKGLGPGVVMSSVQASCVSVCATDLLSSCLLVQLLVCVH